MRWIRILKEMIENNLILEDSMKFTVGDYSGNVDKKIRHLELEKNIIFTTLANNSGIDISGLVMIINTIPLSSDSLLQQIRGRLRDSMGYYVDCYDSGFEGIIRQREKRMINHKKHAKSIVFYEYENGNCHKCFS